MMSFYKKKATHCTSKSIKFFTQLLSIQQLMKSPLYVKEFGATVWSGGQDSTKYLQDFLEVMNSKNMHYTYLSFKFPMRETRSYYAPRIKVFDKISPLLRNLIRNRKTWVSQKSAIKSFFIQRILNLPLYLNKY